MGKWNPRSRPSRATIPRKPSGNWKSACFTREQVNRVLHLPRRMSIDQGNPKFEPQEIWNDVPSVDGRSSLRQNKP